MYKSLIIIFAVYLVGVYAFVKRDAPADAATPGAVTPNYVADIQNKISEYSKNFSQSLTEILKPDNIKKNFNAAVDYISESVDKLKATGEQAQQQPH